MQQQNIISSSCRATPTKYTHNPFSHLLQHIKLTSLISLIFLSVLIEAPAVPALPTVPFDLRTLTNHANYSAAPYCNKPLENWNCGEVCLATDGTEVIKVFTNKKLNTKGYIAVDPVDETIIVSYRGTVPWNFRNWLTDLDFFKDDYIIHGARVHGGFYDSFLSLKNIVTDDVVQLHRENPDFKIGFMGHSLGGAIATFSALDFIQVVPELGKKNELVFLSTFGQPRVGDDNFADYAEENLNAYRTVNRGDPVPHLPPEDAILFNGDFRHFGKELYIENPETDPNTFTVYEAEDPKGSLSGFQKGGMNIAAHTGPYFGGVTMKDCERYPGPGGQSVEDDDDYKEFLNYDYAADPRFVYDPDYDYGAKGVNGTKGHR